MPGLDLYKPSIPFGLIWSDFNFELTVLCSLHIWFSWQTSTSVLLACFFRHSHYWGILMIFCYNQSQHFVALEFLSHQWLETRHFLDEWFNEFKIKLTSCWKKVFCLSDPDIIQDSITNLLYIHQDSFETSGFSCRVRCDACC